MGNSLQEQLLKAGLVTEEDVARVEQEAQHTKAQAQRRSQERRGPRKGKERNKKAKRSSTSSPAKRPEHRSAGDPRTPAQPSPESDAVPVANMSVGLRAAKRRTEDLLKDGKLRSSSPEKREREMKRQRILRIIERHRQDRADADLIHNFVRGTRIKSIYFTAEQREAFMRQEIAIVSFEGRNSLLPVEMVEELLAINTDIFVQTWDDTGGNGEDEDGYPPVPDDITW